VEIVLSGVADYAGNSVSWPITWSFAVADYGASSTSVRVSGVVLNTTYAAFQAKSNELANIRQDLATLLSVSLDRITNVQAVGALGGNVTAVSFIIGPGSTKTAVAAAQDLAKQLIKASPGLTGSLSTAVTCKVMSNLDIFFLLTFNIVCRSARV
jgi:hypothetical protein